jgi:hypothetical protein
MIDDMPVTVMTVDPRSFRITCASETPKSLIPAIEHFLPMKASDLMRASNEVFHQQPAPLPRNAKQVARLSGAGSEIARSSS